jgi:subtilisin family serine protease
MTTPITFTIPSSYSNKIPRAQIDVLLYFSNELSPSDISPIESLGLSFQRYHDNIIHVGKVYSAVIDRNFPLQELESFGFLDIQDGTKQFQPSLLSSTTTIHADEAWNSTLNNQRLLGTGTKIAVIDTGVEWLHPSFWRNTTNPVPILKNGIYYYADLNEDSEIEDNEGPLYHTSIVNPSQIDASSPYLYIDTFHDGLFSYVQGDRWLAGIDDNSDGVVDLNTEHIVMLNQSKVAIFLDQFDDTVYYRNQNMSLLSLGNGDYHGHGTHVSSIALGGSAEFGGYCGVAPGADLIAIKCPLELSDVIEAIYFAIENDADVINMSFSNYAGYMDGTDFEDLLVNEAFMEHGIISSIASGNLGGRAKHAHITIPTGGTGSIQFHSTSPPQYSYINLLWKSLDMDETIILTSPTDETINIGKFSDIADSLFDIEFESIHTEILADTSLRGTHRILIQLLESDHFLYSGDWTIEVTNTDGDSVILDAYLWDNGWSSTYLVFTNHIDYTRIVSSPGTSDLGICVGNYQESTSSISSSSSIGPRIDGVMKPDIVAPGSMITAASNSLTTLWVTRSGTSMAAPHIAGAAALLRQASNDSTGWFEYSALLAGAGGNSSHFELRDFSYGFGLCDLINSINQMTGIIQESNFTFRPLVRDLSIASDDNLINLTFRIHDIDTEQLDLASTWTIHDESSIYYSTGYQSESPVVLIEVDTDSLSSPTGTTAYITITDTSNSMDLPVILIDRGDGGHFFVSDAYFESNHIFDTSELLKGTILIENYNFVSSVKISFEKLGVDTHSFTLAGISGRYDFELNISNFEPGNYSVVIEVNGIDHRTLLYELDPLYIEGQSQSWIEILIAALISLILEPICRFFTNIGLLKSSPIGKRISMVYPAERITPWK